MDTLPHQQILRQQFDHSAEEPLQLKYLIKFGGKVKKILPRLWPKRQHNSAARSIVKPGLKYIL